MIATSVWRKLHEYTLTENLIQLILDPPGAGSIAYGFFQC